MSKEKYSLAENSACGEPEFGLAEQGDWVTVHLSCRTQPGEYTQFDIVETLDVLAARAAAREGVDGVECRDPSMPNVDLEFERPTSPELVAYCRPANARATARWLEQEARSAGLEFDLHVLPHRLVEEDWRDAWKRFHRPIVRGPLLIRPSWIERSPEDPQLELVLDPGRAFGTGLHASTRLCLDHLLALSATISPTRTLDLGCGSGILGLAASRLWPALVTLDFVDIDDEAVEVAHANAEADHIAAGFTCGRAANLAGTYNLVLANLRTDTLVAEASATTRLVRPGGWLVASGILDEELANVRAAYHGFGFREELVLYADGWVSPRLRAPT